MSESPKKNPLPVDARVKTVARVCFALFLALLSIWIAIDFVASIGWAAIIAVATWPLYASFTNRMRLPKGSVLPPAIFTLLTGLILLVPVLLAAHRASQEMEAIGRSVTVYRQQGIPSPEWLPRMPVVGPQAANWWKANLSDPKVVTEWIGTGDGENSATMTRTLGAEVLNRLFHFLIVLIALFGFLKNGAWIANRILDTADQLLGSPGERLASKMVGAIRGTVNGTVAIAFSEGILIGVMYFAAQVPHAFLFTVLTMAFAMVPFGAWIVFTTASVLLVFEGGSVLLAVGVFAFGAVVMLIGDLFAWPSFVGSAARLPFLIALIGIFGGLEAFGLIGLFLGPVILAAMMTVWKEWLMARGATGNESSRVSQTRTAAPGGSA